MLEPVSRKSHFSAPKLSHSGLETPSSLKIREQGWRSGESTHLQPMSAGLKFLTRPGLSLLGCSDKFFPGYSGFPLSLKPNI